MAITEPRPAEQPTPTSASSRDRSRPLFPAVAAGIIVLVAGLMLWSQQRVPSPHPASAPATEFSAERAIVHVDAIGTQTRFLGSSNHERTQRYLLAELRRLGLEPRVQRTAVVNRFSEDLDPSAGTVTNIFARMPGTASTGSIALNAHYDSGPGGPAASDCAACVASVLEAARALRAGPPLRNDVVLVFSDGEENSDLGAAAFAGQSPLMKDIDAVMNWDVSGSHGLPVMLGTNSAWLVGQTLEAAPDARAYSVMPSLFRGALKAQQLNLDTQEYMDRGAAGVQFIYFRGTTDYHTRLDNVDRLGRGSLQMDGDYGLALARKLGNDPQLDRHVGDRSTYFNLTGGTIVQYGPVAAGLLALLAVVLFLAAVAAGRRCHRITVRGLGLGLIAFPVTVLVTTATTVISWALVKQAVPDLRVLTIGTSENEFFVFGLVALALAVFAALYQPLLRRARAEDLALGALAWWLLVAVALTLTSPSAAYLFTVPVLAALAVALWRLSGERDSAWRWAAGISVPAAVLVVVYAPVMLLFTVLAIRLDGMGMPVLGAMGLFASLAAGLFIPYLRLGIPGRRGLAGSRWLGPVSAALLAVVLLGVGALRLDYSASSPRPDFLSYVYDADSGRAAFEATDRDSWSRPLLEKAQRADVELSPFATFSGWRAPAPALDLAGPRLVQQARTTEGTATSLRMRLTSPRGADAAAIDLRTPGPITAASVQGQTIAVNRTMREGRLKLQYVGLPDSGIELVVSVSGHGTARATTRDYTQGLPARLDVPPRPPDSMPAALSFRADPTVVTSTTTVRF